MLDERNLGKEILYYIILVKFSDERLRTVCDDSDRVCGPDHATLLLGNNAIQVWIGEWWFNSVNEWSQPARVLTHNLNLGLSARNHIF